MFDAGSRAARGELLIEGGVPSSARGGRIFHPGDVLPGPPLGGFQRLLRDTSASRSETRAPEDDSARPETPLLPPLDAAVRAAKRRRRHADNDSQRPAKAPAAPATRDGRPVRSSIASARGRRRRPSARPASAGLGLPAAGAVADPRQAGELGVAVEDQVAQGAGGEVGGGDASPA